MVEFGSFQKICETAALVICPLVESDQGVEPICYSRNVDVGGTLIFQPCECGVVPVRHRPQSLVSAPLPLHFTSTFFADYPISQQRHLSTLWLSS